LSLELDLRTLRQFKEVYAAIRAHLNLTIPTRRPIGFTANLDKKD
jgi:hypothetical protein